MPEKKPLNVENIKTNKIIPVCLELRQLRQDQDGSVGVPLIDLCC